MQKNSLISQILLITTEDYCGLWEILAEAKSIYPEMSNPVLIEMIKEILQEFLEMGWIDLYWCQEPLTNENVKAIREISIYDLDLSDKHWDQPTKDSISVRILTTNAGEKEFAKRFLR